MNLLPGLIVLSQLPRGFEGLVDLAGQSGRVDRQEIPLQDLLLGRRQHPTGAQALVGDPAVLPAVGLADDVV